MRSFQRQPDNRRAVFLQLAGSIESQLRQAFAKRHEKDGLTQAKLSDKLGVNRSAVHKRLTGRNNLTVETIADMVWGLGHCIRVEIFDPNEGATNQFHINPEQDDHVLGLKTSLVDGAGNTSTNMSASIAPSKVELSARSTSSAVRMKEEA